MRYSLFFLLLFAGIHTLPAQIFRAKSDTSAMTWKIRFVPDIGLQVISKTEQQFYQGEKIYFQGNDNYWKWVTNDTSIKGPSSLEKVSAFRLGVMLNLVDNVYVGFSYTPLLMRRYKTYYYNGQPVGTNLETVTLFSLNGTVGYDYTLPFYKRLTLQPSVSLGGYQSNRDYEGPGNEWFYEGRLALAFRPFKNNQIRVWGAYQNYAYRENAPSYIFDQNRTVKIDVAALTWGLGYSFNINIKEDYKRERKEPKEKKKNSKQ